MYENPNLKIQNLVTIPTLNWQSPSNIALIKYWGKFGNQYPKNASISLTLKHAYTQTQVAGTLKNNYLTDNTISLNFTFENQEKPLFAQKIETFFSNLLPIYPFLSQIHFHIQSFNSFPHSSGIASSASSMSALALCLCDLENQLFATLQNPNHFLQKASYIARLGSGSACRSVYPSMALWGNTNTNETACNHYAIPFTNYHSVFESLCDAILIVSKEEKKVSSRAGHNLMNNNPFANVRYQQAEHNLKKLLLALQHGNLPSFIEIIENEALTLHALMMTSNPSFILMQPETLKIIEKIKQFRADTNLPICFTLDAGPNVHLLYLKQNQHIVHQFIHTELLPLCQHQTVLYDEMGTGAIKL